MATITGYGYPKHDLRLAAYRGAVLQRCEFKGLYGNNGNGHYSWSFDIFKKKIRLVLMPCCLFYCHVASQLDPKPFKRVASLVFLCFFRFPLLSRDTTTQVKHNLSYPSFLTLNSYDFYFWWRTQSDCKPAIAGFSFLNSKIFTVWYWTFTD